MNRAAAILVLALLASAPAIAKCGWTSYEVTVSVIDRRSGDPLEGVDLIFFVPNSDDALALEREGGATTDSDGSWVGRIRFNTYSGWFLTDKCNASLKKLEVVAVAKTRRAQRFRFQALRSRPSAESHVHTLEPLRIAMFP